METWLHIYQSLACLAASCLAIPAGPVAVWALIQHYRK